LRCDLKPVRFAVAVGNGLFFCGRRRCKQTNGRNAVAAQNGSPRNADDEAARKR
jgi:hypothetical protein